MYAALVVVQNCRIFAAIISILFQEEPLTTASLPYISYFREISDEIDRCLGTNLKRKNLLLSDIKKIISDTKYSS